MSDNIITLRLTENQAISTLSAVCGHRMDLEQLRQDMLTRRAPQAEIQVVERESYRMAEVEEAIKEAL